MEKLLGKDYEVITADDRLDKLAEDFVEHCATRWEAGKSMLVCIDKITCGRMLQRIEPRWKARLSQVKAQIVGAEAKLATTTDPDETERLSNRIMTFRGQAEWMESTIIEIIISEAQNEIRDFKKWGLDIIPHRVVMKKGFETPDGKRVAVDDAFKDPQHPFRIAIICAMWLTGFDVECLSTLYIDKPMKAHTLMQAIARANRVYPGKDCGVIVDYNGMLKSLREALAQYALGDEDDGATPAILWSRLKSWLSPSYKPSMRRRIISNSSVSNPHDCEVRKGFSGSRRCVMRLTRSMFPRTPSGALKSWHGRSSLDSKLC